MKKYSKVTREDYKSWHRGSQEYRDRVNASPYRLFYHLMPETGWLNDPNGLCQIDGVYHIYYQFTPFEPTGEIKLWGHFTTRDFVHYVNEEPVLFPDRDFDAHGVYSGCAFAEKDGTIHYFYTGNVKYLDRTDYDYIMTGRESNTVHFTSRDGYDFSEKEAILTARDYPEDMSCHVRDPKILKQGDSYYMALGARDDNSRGLALLYKSKDLKNWSYHGRIRTRDRFGYMWECPDLLWLDGCLCLICCPQGVEPRGADYCNVHQCTVIPLNYDFEPGEYLIEDNGAFSQVDRGFDFYAPQTFEDEKGRRILIGWMGIPDAEYTNPTTEYGWQHCLTIPRELHLEDGTLIQKPVEELKALRGEKWEFKWEEFKTPWEKESDHIQEKRTADPEKEGRGREEAGKDDIGNGLVYECLINFDMCRSMTLTLRQGAELVFENGWLTLDIEPCGSGRTQRKVNLVTLEQLQIFSDTSSLEIFVNGGREVFTTRVYGEKKGFRLEGDCSGNCVIYELNRIVGVFPR